MEKKYFIGIDFGHEFTSVSRVPGYNNEEISRILLRRSSFVKDQKVMSAICKHNDGWHFVWPEDDITRIEIRQGFKGIIKELDPISKEAFGEFAKLVFRNVLENDQDLIYNENTGESNFTICIACPSYWHHKDPQIPKEYLIFFRDECNIKPIEMCINESDSILLHNCRYLSLSNTTIFQIDLGTSTIDFSVYSNLKYISECCWGVNLGTFTIVDIIVDYIFINNRDNLKKIQACRQDFGSSEIYAIISKIVKKSVEDFFVNDLSFFECYVPFRYLVPNWPSRLDEAFDLYLPNEEFMHLIHDYRERLVQCIKHASAKLSNFGVKPNVVLLSGVGCKIGFIRDVIKTEFSNTKILFDISPEYAISNGNALYARANYMSNNYSY